MLVGSATGNSNTIDISKLKSCQPILIEIAVDNNGYYMLSVTTRKSDDNKYICVDGHTNNASLTSYISVRANSINLSHAEVDGTEKTSSTVIYVYSLDLI